jgi:hypothetical protein
VLGDLSGVRIIHELLKNQRLEIPFPLVRMARLGVQDISPWHMIQRVEHVQSLLAGARRENPTRNLVPFAIRGDQDEAAFFELDRASNGRVPIVMLHWGVPIDDLANDRWPSFDDWFREAVAEFYEFMRAPRQDEEPGL